MRQLPELLSGAIAQEYQETIEAGWLASEPEKGPGTPSNTIAPCEQTCRAPLCDDDSLPVDCTVGGDTCPVTGCGKNCTEKKYSAAFHPTLAGWSAPPALPLP